MDMEWSTENNESSILVYIVLKFMLFPGPKFVFLKKE